MIDYLPGGWTMATVQVQIRGADYVGGILRRAAAALAGGGQARVGNSPGHPYAAFVHDGWTGHPVYPVNKKALYWQGAGHPVAMVANNKGYRGNRYLDDAKAAAEIPIQALFAVRVGGMLLGGGGRLAQVTMEAAEQIVLPLARERVNVRTGNLLADLHATRG